MRPRVPSPARQRLRRLRNFTITATDGLGASSARAYSVTINPAITVNPATLPNGTVGIAYSQTVSATGGTGSYTFSVSAGSLPAGLSLNAATGAITGTPTTAATSNFTITATDGLGATGARAYVVTINRGDHRKSSDVAERHGRNCVLANSQCDGRYWLVHVQRLGGQLASGSFTECGHRCHHRHANHCRDCRTSRSPRPMG